MESGGIFYGFIVTLNAYLNLKYWHSFIDCVKEVGVTSRDIILPSSFVVWPNGRR
jgi:hypothetical protein